MTYQPREDSLFLQEYLEEQELAGKKVLDMGTGSGILAVTAAEKEADVTAADIDPGALEDAEELAEEKDVDVEFVESDLFDNVEGKFDLVVFNPPYLQGDRFNALEGGESGVELTSRFLQQSAEHLEEEGEVIFIASSRSDVDSLQNEFELELLDTRKLWFETLYLFKSD
ncbi:MAG: HemK2/MTQ2 family protein methyltransferase [Candidatus Nanohaloarchaea archaeon]